MIKIVFTWRDNPKNTQEENEAHYHRRHMVLAREAFTGAEGFQLLLYNRVRAHRVNDFNSPVPRAAEPDIDAFVELYFDTRENLEAAMGKPILAEMFKDHENFMATDVPANIKIYEVEEEIILGRHPG